MASIDYLHILKGLFPFLLQRLQNIGKAPICNGCTHRAPHIGGICFLLCWRCSGVYLSYFASKLFFSLQPIFNFNAKIINFTSQILSLSLACLVILPMVVDGIWQYRNVGYESTNARRFFTGLLAGIALLMMREIIMPK